MILRLFIMEQTIHCVSQLKAPQQRTKTATCVDPPRHRRVSLVQATFMMFYWRDFLPRRSIFIPLDPPRSVDNLDRLSQRLERFSTERRKTKSKVITLINHSCNNTDNRVNWPIETNQTCSEHGFWCSFWLVKKVFVRLRYTDTTSW